MIITTTPTIEGRPIKDYKGVIFSEVVLGIDFIKDFGASFRNIFGGRSTGYEDEIKQAQAQVIEELKSKASYLGGNAVVGLKLDYESLGEGGAMIMVIGSATVVEI